MRYPVSQLNFGVGRCWLLRLFMQTNALPPTLSNNDELVMAFDKYIKEVAGLGLASATRLIRRSDVYRIPWRLQ